MSPKLLLLEDVEDLGKAGDTVNVAAGFARNYLKPRGLAIETSTAALRQLEKKKTLIQENRKKDLDDAKALSTKISEMEVTIPMQAGDDNQLFGSVTSAVIAEELEKQGVSIETRKIKLDQGIKELGVYSVEIKIHADVVSTLKVWIVRA